MSVRGTIRIVAVLGIIAAITFLCRHVVQVNSTTAGFTYLIAVLMIATTWGLREATVASVAAMLCFNFFFLPPVGTLTIADFRNWIALFAFLATAIIASHLSARAQHQAHEARERRQDTERLYALSRAILLTPANRKAPRQFASEIAQIFDFPSVALYDRDTDDIYHGGPSGMPGIDKTLRQAALQGNLFHDNPSGTTVAPIHLGGKPIASLAVRGYFLSDSALQAVSNLVAIGLEKVHGQESASQAEAARRSNELKSTLLDAIAHEFKTPLTSIKAAASALLLDSAHDAAQQRELVTIVNEETDRLSRLVTEAIQMARIEAGEIQLNRKLCDVQSLLPEVQEHLRPLTEGRTFDVQVQPDLPCVGADVGLLELAIRQVIDNALKYSPPRSSVSLQATTNGSSIVITVRDHGAGIPTLDQSLVFEKFYRGSNIPSEITGTGMGLAIARQILRAHGGDIWVSDSSENGSEFSISLPVAREESEA